MKNLFLAIFGGLAIGCSQDSPTTPSLPAPLPTHEPGAATSTDVVDAATIEFYREQLRTISDEMSNVGASQLRYAAHEDFNCTNVEEVRVRFSEPGFIDLLNVGLFVKFIGVPAGTKTLRIWWDYAADFHKYQNVVVGDGDVNPEKDGEFDIEMVIQHTYRNAGMRRVRVELILEGVTGNCARNRDVFVTPESYDFVVSSGGLGNCISFPGFRAMGLRVNFSPPIPPGTSYTVRFRVTGGGVSFPVFTIADVTPTGGPTMALPTQFTAPPNDFSVTLSPAVDHEQLVIATGIVAGSISRIDTRIVSIQVPGRTVQVVGSIAASCS